MGLVSHHRLAVRVFPDPLGVRKHISFSSKASVSSEYDWSAPTNDGLATYENAEGWDGTLSEAELTARRAEDFSAPTNDDTATFENAEGWS